MTRPSLDELNAPVLAYVAQHSAHSDVVMELQRSLHGLGAAVMHGDLAAYRAPHVTADGVVFACATGMHHLHFRLPPVLLDRARATGAEGSSAGPDWAMFTLFRTDWPQFDLVFWARKAYDSARGLAAS
jgi:hypothetical protein